jgi:BirA family biotin operon repressor/biotin-[acetyl-CoA-carboxylase] ligase
MDFLDPDMIRHELGSSLFATKIVYHKTVGSTNTLAKGLASKGAPEGTVVLTEEQTSGRGRRGRVWHSPGYVNLMFSLLLRPTLKPDQIFVLTMILALATINALKHATGLKALIKWPNDLYVRGKKIGGILTEFSVRGARVDSVVLGLGLNVNWNPSTEEQTINPATSLLAETGLKISRNELLMGILILFEDYYGQVLSGKIEDFYKKWNEVSMLMGREVQIEFHKQTLRGKAVRIDRSGALVIEDKNGKEKKIISGDVSVRF